MQNIRSKSADTFTPDWLLMLVVSGCFLCTLTFLETYIGHDNIFPFPISMECGFSWIIKTKAKFYPES